MIELKKEIAELSKAFIMDWFKELRKSWKYEKYRKALENKNIPWFLAKTITRYEDKLLYWDLIENIQNKTNLTEKDIKEKLAKGITITKILSLYKK